MTTPLWTFTDLTGDVAWLGWGSQAYNQHPGVATIGIDRREKSFGVYLTREAAQGLRDALDRLLADPLTKSAPEPTARSALEEVAAQVEANADALEDNLRHRATDFACRDAHHLAADVQLLALELRRLAHALAGGAS